MAGAAAISAIAVDYSKKAVREIANLDWSRAIDYGLRTGALIRAQTGTATSAVRKFLDGQPPDEKETP